MAKANSYFDWELKFKKIQNSKPKFGRDVKKENNVNTLGIQEKTFNAFLKKWKKKHFL